MPRYDDDDDFDDIRLPSQRSRATGPLEHSGLGMASISIAAFMFLAFLGLFGVIAVIEANNNGPMQEDEARDMLVGLAFLAGLGFTLVGLVLGIVGCCQPNRSSVCGLLGALFNGIILVGVFFLICLGVAIGG